MAEENPILDRCTCEDNTHDEHSCPYESDVNEDADYLCTCCPFCENNCRERI